MRRPRRAGPAPRLSGAAAAPICGGDWSRPGDLGRGLRLVRPFLPDARGLGGGAFALRAPRDASEHRGGVAVQDLLARVLPDLRFGERLPGPVDAELGAVGAAHDTIGAVQPHGRFDRARTERVAANATPPLPEAR